MNRRRWDKLPYLVQLALTGIGCALAFVGGFGIVTILQHVIRPP
ncbi:hypothetical protein ACI7YT_12560 [Microbacterium sp. M]